MSHEDLTPETHQNESKIQDGAQTTTVDLSTFEENTDVPESLGLEALKDGKTVSDQEPEAKEAKHLDIEEVSVHLDEDAIERTDIDEGKTAEEAEMDTFDDFEKFMAVEKEQSPETFTLQSGDQDEPEEGEEKEMKKKKKRKHTISIRSSYSSLYEHTPERDRVPNISGDFSQAVRGHQPTLSAESSSEDEDEEEEEKEKVTEEEKPSLTEYERYDLYLTLEKLMKEYEEEKMKNRFLLSKLANYYKRRKMYYVLHEGKVKVEVQKKYEKQLDDFELIMRENSKALVQIKEEIDYLCEKCSTSEQEAAKCFEKLQRNELEVGKDIMSSEKGYETKIIERYLKRQKNQLAELTKIRLDYINIRNKVNETQEALNALDNLGPGLYLVDYEQLKEDNRNLHDKLEEKQLELTTVRRKCQSTMQILAHKREKVDALETDIKHLNQQLDEVAGEQEDVREQINNLKCKRDMHRTAIHRVKQQSGLLSKPKLLRDMDKTIEEAKELSKKVGELKQEYDNTFQKVKNLKKNTSSPKKLLKIQEAMKKHSNDVTKGIAMACTDLEKSSK